MTMIPPTVDGNRIALGVRQPWVELILRGEKWLEVRSQPVSLRGRIYLYASRRYSDHPAATKVLDRLRDERVTCDLGLLLGSVELTDCRRATRMDAAGACIPEAALEGQYVWRLERPERFEAPVEVVYQPYGVWFYPFQRKRDGKRSGA